MFTLKTLLEQMTDRGRLARWPDCEFRSRQFSSYDRSSVAHGSPGWFGNKDYNEFLRKESHDGRTEFVLLDADGPGVITRFWHADGGELWKNGGIIRFYLDNNPVPAIEAPLRELIGGNLLADKPFSYTLPDNPLYGEENYLARNFFLPIPYARYCKITWEDKSGVMVEGTEKKWGCFYYNIECMEFPKTVEVETFSMELLGKYAEAIAAAGKILLDPQKSLEPAADTAKVEKDILPDSSSVIFSRSGGSGAVRRMRLSVEADDFEQALRSTIIEMRFDGKLCVWCPAGEFFGTGYDIYPHTTWFTRVHEANWLQCLWVMPFANSAEIRLRNLGGQNVSIRAEIDCGNWNWDGRSMHFHATWSQATKFKSSEHADYNYVTVKGRGVYVGDSLTVFCSRPARWDSTWWGEGDEKIYVDGEKFPSHFGTGTEDYYGYSWCRPNFFEKPLHAQPCGRGNKRGGLSINKRYRILDVIPFRESFRFDMEIWLPFKDKGQSVNFAPATFFYAFPEAEIMEPKPDAATARLPVVLTQRQFENQE